MAYTRGKYAIGKTTNTIADNTTANNNNNNNSNNGNNINSTTTNNSMVTPNRNNNDNSNNNDSIINNNNNNNINNTTPSSNTMPPINTIDTTFDDTDPSSSLLHNFDMDIDDNMYFGKSLLINYYQIQTKTQQNKTKNKKLCKDIYE